MKRIFVLLLIISALISIFFIGIFTVHAAGNGIDWTEGELKFLEEHPIIRLGVDPRFVPFEFIDENGEYKGIATDYLGIISERTGLEFLVPNDLTWPEAYDKALRYDLDALPAIGKTTEREEHFLFFGTILLF